MHPMMGSETIRSLDAKSSCCYDSRFRPLVYLDHVTLLSYDATELIRTKADCLRNLVARIPDK
jgi:hypothetical protein